MGSIPTRRTEQMRSLAEISSVLTLIEHGLNDSAIARETGISRTTIRQWRRNGAPGLRAGRGTCVACSGDLEALPSSRYAYLLGQYLGDGFIARMPNGVFVLRIFSFSGYPNIIKECTDAMAAVLPNKVRVASVPGVNLVVITSYSKHWPCLFPQHGVGRKHERPIQLATWQQSIVEHHPEAFLRGLIHSDGCRYINRVKKYEYPSYGFTNMSLDIATLFTDACDQVGVRWRRSSFKNIAVTRRESVAIMDSFIGPKT